MKGPLLGIIIVLALLGTAAIFFAGTALAPAPTPVVEQLYSNGVYGISFSYPSGYILSEEARSEGDTEHYSITLIREADAVPVVGAGEGPTAITLDIYRKDEDDVLLEWLDANAHSNFGLGDKTYVETRVGEAPSVHYSWSGLYEGETTAFFHKDWVVLVSVTYMSPEDEIRSTYLYVLESLRLR